MLVFFDIKLMINIFSLFSIIPLRKDFIFGKGISFLSTLALKVHFEECCIIETIFMQPLEVTSFSFFYHPTYFYIRSLAIVLSIL